MNTLPLSLPLEDSWTDVLGKAMRGTGLDEARLSSVTGLPPARLKAILDGEKPDEGTLRTLATALGLRPGPVIGLAAGRYHPGPLDSARWPGVLQVPSRYHDMIVNTWLVWDPASRKAVIFDSGADAGAILTAVAHHRLEPVFLCLTHTHVDHVEALPEIARTLRLRIVAPKDEPFAGAESASEGTELAAGILRLRARLTDGHSRGHLSWIVTGHAAWPAPVAVVGDALFAGSMGGGQVSYTRLRANVREKILSLPRETLLCPGHGPATTVASELENNPFA